MSEQTTPINTGQQMTVNTNLSKMFLWNNRYESAVYTAGASETTLLQGTLMGRIHATGKVVPLESGATDGSQFPVGILSNGIVVPANATVNVTICVAGDVAAEKIVFQGSDTLETVVTARRLKDRIGFDTVGIKLVTGTELTNFDNV